MTLYAVLYKFYLNLFWKFGSSGERGKELALYFTETAFLISFSSALLCVLSLFLPVSQAVDYFFEEINKWVAIACLMVLSGIYHIVFNFLLKDKVIQKAESLKNSFFTGFILLIVLNILFPIGSMFIIFIGQ